MCEACKTEKLESPAITVLEKNLSNLSPNDQVFAKSLIAAARSKKGLSAKQGDWIFKMGQRAMVKKEPLPTDVIGQMQGIIALFEKAGKKLKFPAVMLNDQTVGPVRLYPAGPMAKFPGSITVVSPTKEWHGRVHLDGKFEHKDDCPETLIDLLAAFAAEPSLVAAEYGKVSGRCAFCGTALNDPRSVAVGYGKICAKNWQLPYGVAEAEKQSDLFNAQWAAKKAEKVS